MPQKFRAYSFFSFRKLTESFDLGEKVLGEENFDKIQRSEDQKLSETEYMTLMAVLNAKNIEKMDFQKAIVTFPLWL